MATRVNEKDFRGDEPRGFGIIRGRGIRGEWLFQAPDVFIAVIAYNDVSVYCNHFPTIAAGPVLGAGLDVDEVSEVGRRDDNVILGNNRLAGGVVGERKRPSLCAGV